MTRRTGLWYGTAMRGKRVAIRVEAPAKINLFLDVLGRRENGYHEIRSLVAPVSVFDRLELRATDGDIGLTVEDDPEGIGRALSCEEADRNLAVRAARLLQGRTGCKNGVSIRLRKGIPVGGGLGGGSADAAATLNGLNDLWKLGLGRAEIAAMGAEIGCDVPALVHGGAVVVEGFGEKVAPVPPARKPEADRRWWMLVVNPRFGVSTRDIYARHNCGLTPADKMFIGMISAWSEGDVGAAAGCLFNSLQATVFAKYPAIAILAERVRQAGALGALLSGSGASVFGLACDEAHAHRLREQVAERYGAPVWARVARILPDGVMAAHGPLEA